MKKHILILSLILFPIVGFCQQLSLTDLIKIHHSELDVVNNFLSTKKYVFQGKKDEDSENMGSIKWGTDSQDNILVLAIRDGNRFFTRYVSQKPLPELYMKEINTQVMEKLESGMNDNGEIFSTYKNSEYVVKFRTFAGGVNSVELFYTFIYNRH